MYVHRHMLVQIFEHPPLGLLCVLRTLHLHELIHFEIITKSPHKPQARAHAELSLQQSKLPVARSHQWRGCGEWQLARFRLGSSYSCAEGTRTGGPNMELSGSGQRCANTSSERVQVEKAANPGQTGRGF